MAGTDGVTAEYYADWIANGSEVDVRGFPNCVDVATRSVLARTLGQALRFYSAVAFVDPSPARLGPVVPKRWQSEGETGEAVRFYLENSDSRGTSSPGAVNGRACGPPRTDSGQLAYMMFKPHRLVGLTEDELAWVAAHELAHVVQLAQPLWQTPNGVCEPLIGWVMESLADAMTGAFFRSSRPSLRPTESGQPDFAKHMLGLRLYDESLTKWIPPPEPGWSMAYRASSFWRWLSERYHGGAPGFYAKVMQTPHDDPTAPDWLGWLDGLMGPERPWGVAHYLPVAFASFLASYADWGTSRWPHVGDETWRRQAVGNCFAARLSPEQSSYVLDLTLEPFSAACVEVTVEDIPWMGPSWYSVRYGDALPPVEMPSRQLFSSAGDDLHLAYVEWGGSFAESRHAIQPRPQRCHQEEAALIRNDNRIAPACVVEFVAAAKEGGFTYAYLAPARSSPAWTDVLLLVRAPAYATDAEYGGLPEQDYRVTFALETAVAAVDGGTLGSTYGSGNDRPPGLRQMPVLAGEGVPGLDELDVSKLMFFQQAPGGLAAEFATPNAAGLHRVWLLESDDLDADDVGFLFTFTPEGAPIPYGATGAFTDWTLGGVDGRRFGTLGAMLGGERGRAVITVLAWTEDQLRVQARGDWCYADELDRDGKCAVTRSLDADLWLAFGDAYDGANPYFAVDTPMQAIYRDTFGRAVWGDFDFDDFDFDFDDFDFDFDDADAPTDGPGASGGPGGSRGVRVGDTPAFECACTCDMLAEIDRLSESLDTSAPGAMELVMSIGTCAIRCGAEFALCED